MDTETTDKDTEGMRWHFIQAHSGHEKRASENLRDRVLQSGLDHDLGEVLVPQETVMEVRDGVRVPRVKKLYPGYILVQMRYSTEMWHAIRSAQRVMGFVGFSGREKGGPPVVEARTVEGIKSKMFIDESAPQTVPEFSKGDTVRVIDGPFKNFSGSVEEVNSEKGKVRVLVSIFGRSTPVELDFVQVEPTNP